MFITGSSRSSSNRFLSFWWLTSKANLHSAYTVSAQWIINSILQQLEINILKSWLGKYSKTQLSNQHISGNVVYQAWDMWAFSNYFVFFIISDAESLEMIPESLNFINTFPIQAWIRNVTIQKCRLRSCEVLYHGLPGFETPCRRQVIHTINIQAHSICVQQLQFPLVPIVRYRQLGCWFYDKLVNWVCLDQRLTGTIIASAGY
jgi:hypothetical protein